MEKRCAACGQAFEPNPRIRNQIYCPSPMCQRERRRRWQQQKRRDDVDYRDNDARSRKSWANENPEYWKQYRGENPDYAERNRIRAAEYVRMSTEHQQYSTENQADKIREYAPRGIEIVKTYADEGKSGLRIDGRQALQQLIKDVETGAADFQIILVYDVSRWGRFQDADESAYYEYICRRAGIQVAYCAEQFENDGSPCLDHRQRRQAGHGR
jgi:hypothetical protein